MIGLSYLLVFALYIALWRWAVRRARSWAKGSGRNPTRWAIAAHLAMYSLVFWDLIPAFSVWGYECGTQAGFTLYKTLDEWKKENPGVAKTLQPIANPEWIKKGNTTRVPLNQRFMWEFTDRHLLFRVSEHRERIIDSKTGETLAEYIDFGTKWFKVSSCESAGHNLAKKQFNELFHLVKYKEGIDL